MRAIRCSYVRRSPAPVARFGRGPAEPVFESCLASRAALVSATRRMDVCDLRKVREMERDELLGRCSCRTMRS